MTNSEWVHRTILPPAQQALWDELAPAASLGFVLYGGTAVALRLGHRVSIDFDFFTEQPLDHDTVLKSFSFMKYATVLQEQPRQLTIQTQAAGVQAGGVKISFFGDIGFGRVGVPERSGDGCVQIASLDDLMACKLKVILQRAEVKDYRDIAAMLRAKVDLSMGLAAACTLFGDTFQPSESLKALTYFADGDLYHLSEEDRIILAHAAGSVRDLPRISLTSSRLTL